LKNGLRDKGLADFWADWLSISFRKYFVFPGFSENFFLKKRGNQRSCARLGSSLYGAGAWFSSLDGMAVKSLR